MPCLHLSERKHLKSPRYLSSQNMHFAAYGVTALQEKRNRTRECSMTRDQEAVLAWYPVAVRELGLDYNRTTFVYEHYCAWCEDRDLEPMALPTFGKFIRDGLADRLAIDGCVRLRLRPVPTAPTAA